MHTLPLRERNPFSSPPRVFPQLCSHPSERLLILLRAPYIQAHILKPSSPDRAEPLGPLWRRTGRGKGPWGQKGSEARLCHLLPGSPWAWQLPSLLYVESMKWAQYLSTHRLGVKWV